MMKTNFQKIGLFLISFLILSNNICLLAQSDHAIYSENQIKEHLENFPEENLFLHISKNYFLTGERLWYRVFHFSPRTNRPFLLSKVVYIEIINAENIPVLQTKIKISNNGGSGDIYLPTSLNSGNYKIVAYTKWMRNFGQSQFFSSEITIINPFKRLNLQSDNSKPHYDLQLFPEGGDLIDGLNTRIAFKGTNQYGKAISFKGAILSHGQDTIVGFRSNRLGMGSFELTPKDEAAYQAILIDDTGRSFNFPFPEVRETGYSIRMDPEEGGYIATVKGKNVVNSTLYLSGISRNKATFFQIKSMDRNETTFKIPEDSLSEGINQFTVFDSNGIPVCERKVFRYPNNGLKITAEIDNDRTGIRKPVEIYIQTSDRYGAPISADLSVSIYKTDSSLLNEQASFESFLWLLSELKGPVEDPEYYFDNVTKQKLNDMDNLMLSQGWSKYDLEKILNTKDIEIKFIPEFIDQLSSATIKNSTDGEIVPGKTVTISFPNHYAQLFVDRSDGDGRLTFETWNVYGNKSMIINTKTKEDSKYIISFDPEFANLNLFGNHTPFFVSQSDESFLIDQSINMQVENAFEPELDDQNLPDSSSFYGIPDASYLLDDYTRFPVMEEVMREYVYGVNVRHEDGKFVFKVLNIPRNETMTNGPLVLLDGVPVYDTDNIMKIDPLNIRRIDVVHRKYYYGSLDCNGIVAFYSYKSDLPDFKLDANTIRQNYQGFQVNKTFYSPKYDTPESMASRIPDFRNELLWEPYLQTDVNGIGKITFYTSDKPGEFRIQIHGLSTNGLPGSFSNTFIVNISD